MEAANVQARGERALGGVDEEVLRLAYRNVLLTRGIEERGHILYRQGKVPGSFYAGRGNEVTAVGVAMAMAPDDVGPPVQRDLGVHVARGMEPWRILAQYMGRVDGPARGATEASISAIPSWVTGRWSAICRRCSRLPLVAPLRFGSGRSGGWRSAGSARDRPPAATPTRR